MILILDHTNNFIRYKFNDNDVRKIKLEKNIIRNNVIVNYDLIKKYWKKIISRFGKVDKLVITDPLFNGDINRKKIKNIMLCSFNIERVYFISKQLISLYGELNKTTGLVIDIGKDYNSRIVPIYDGILLRGSLISSFKGNNKFNDKKYFQKMNDYLIDDILKAIDNSPIDLRRELYSNIVIIGNGSLRNNIGFNLLKMIRDKRDIKVPIFINCPRDRRNILIKNIDNLLYNYNN